ncbi:unnamed protein product [Sphagnum balticum]
MSIMELFLRMQYMNFREFKMFQRLEIEKMRHMRKAGPDIETVAEDLLDHLYDFLEDELHINFELLENVANYSRDAEQIFYVNWLKDLKSLV